MVITVSIETPKKVKLGEFEDPTYAAAFVKGVLEQSLKDKNYIKIVTELSEKED